MNIKHNKNLIQEGNKWIYKIPFRDIIYSKVPMKSLIMIKRERIANYIGIKGYKIYTIGLVKCREEQNVIITYETKRISLLRRIKQVL